LGLGEGRYVLAKAKSEKPVASRSATKRIIYFDILNIFACFCVILLHHNGIVHDYSVARAIDGAWSQALIVEVLAFFAVPIFLMLTGATLMKYRERYDTKTFFKKRLSRVLVPFIIWMVLYFVFLLARGDIAVGNLNPQYIFELFMYNKMNGTFWFFPLIIAIYLSMPVLSVLSQPKHRKTLWYIVLVGFVTHSLLPPVLDLCGLSFNGAYGLPIIGGAGYLIYPILGYLLATTKKVPIKALVISGLATIGCLLLRFFVTYYWSLADGQTNTVLFSYVQFTAVIPTVFIFLLARVIKWDKIFRGKAVAAITKISACSLGIYLLHMMAMQIEQSILGWETTRLLWRTVGAIITYLVCLTVVFVVKSGVISRRLFP
jgi:surface polysaccharide O-acyltransferase-like enzyme